jgi:DNA-directed RNA polymerase specialized sigma24 family protein
MGRTEGAVKSLYHRTLLSLREEVGDAMISPDMPGDGAA